MYASLALASTKIFATRPKLTSSLLPPTKPRDVALIAAAAAPALRRAPFLPAASGTCHPG